MSQVHSKFKVFYGSPDPSNPVGNLGKEIEDFVKESKVAAKSIGVEYLEATKHLVMTLGYADDQDCTPVKVSAVNLGYIDIEHEITKLEKKMAEAANNLHGIICHELYITEENEFFMVFMCHSV